MRLFKHPAVPWLALAALGLGTIAQAQAPRGPPCINRGQVIAQLQTMFGERAIGRGLAEGGFVFELFASPSGSWTVLATTPQGLSCYVASGQAWDPVPAPTSSPSAEKMTAPTASAVPNAHPTATTAPRFFGPMLYPARCRTTSRRCGRARCSNR